jgi:hypothetical protein
MSKLRVKQVIITGEIFFCKIISSDLKLDQVAVCAGIFSDWLADSRWVSEIIATKYKHKRLDILMAT